MSMRNRTYSELVRYTTFEDRFAYLKLDGAVGSQTFGFDRYLNQMFYSSHEWKTIREYVIIRDNGCDLGVQGYEIHANLLIHHINPMTQEDIVHQEEWILDPEFLITTTHNTHNTIHYGNESLLPKVVPERKPGDTRLW
jgi:hypothetical protein